MSDELRALINTERSVHQQLTARRDLRDRPLRERLDLALKTKHELEDRLARTRSQTAALEQRIGEHRARLMTLEKGLSDWQRLKASVLEPVLLSASLFLSLLSLGLVSARWRMTLAIFELIAVTAGLVASTLLKRRKR